MNVKELIAGLAKKAGIATDNEDLLTLTTASALGEVEVPESLSEILTYGAGYSKEEAKNDREIQAFYHEKLSAKIYENFDDIINKNIDSLPLSDEQKDEINSKENATQKAKALFKAVSDIKAKPSKDADVEKYNNQIKELNDAIKSLKETHTSELETVKRQSYDNETDFLIKNKILSAPLIENVPGGKDFLAEAIIKKVRSSYHLERDDSNNLLIKDKQDPSLEVFKDNERVDFEKVLSQELHPFIKRSDDPKKPNQPPLQKEVKNPAQMTYHERLRAASV